MGSMPKSFTWKVGNMRLGAAGRQVTSGGEEQGRPTSTSSRKGGLPAGCFVWLPGPSLSCSNPTKALPSRGQEKRQAAPCPLF